MYLPPESVRESNFTGGKIGHIARNCPMNEGGGYGQGGGFGGGQQSGGYNDSGKTCYACGGFGMFHLLPYLTCRPHGKRLQSRPKMLQLRPFRPCQSRLRSSRASESLLQVRSHELRF